MIFSILDYLIIVLGLVTFVTNFAYVILVYRKSRPWCFLKVLTGLGGAYLSGLYIIIHFCLPEPDIMFSRLFVKPIFVYITTVWAASGIFRLRCMLFQRQTRRGPK